MTADKDENPMTRLAEDAVELATAGQKAVLDVIAAEMRVLSAMVPGLGAGLGAGLGHATETPEAQKARLSADDAAVEAGFDNMPI